MLKPGEGFVAFRSQGLIQNGRAHTTMAGIAVTRAQMESDWWDSQIYESRLFWKLTLLYMRNLTKSHWTGKHSHTQCRCSSTKGESWFRGWWQRRCSDWLAPHIPLAAPSFCEFDGMGQWDMEKGGGQDKWQTAEARECGCLSCKANRSFLNVNKSFFPSYYLEVMTSSTLPNFAQRTTHMTLQALWGVTDRKEIDPMR